MTGTLGSEVNLRPWPTPTAGDSAGGRTTSKGKEYPTSLNAAVRGLNPKWPTPKASPSGPDFAQMDREGSGGDDLATAVEKDKRMREVFPTPRAEDSQCAGGHRDKDDTLYGKICKPKAKPPEDPTLLNLDSAPPQDPSPHKAEFPTPSATSYGSSGNGTGNNKASRGRPSLEAMAAKDLWATPQARDGKSGSTSEKTRNKNSRPLNEQVKFPTPTVGDSQSSGSRTAPGSKAHPGISLTDAIVRGQKLTTPRTKGMCGGTGNFEQMKKLEESGAITEQERRQMTAGNGGQLNPRWVEWLMGWPIGWTALDSAGMAWFQSKPTRSSKKSSRSLKS